MRLLIDSHVFLWWGLDSPRLSASAGAAIADRRNEVLVSAATVWELTIKAARGKLELAPDPATFFAEQMSINGFSPLPVRAEHAVAVWNLPNHHADPFDRILVAQAIVESATLVTADQRLPAYPVPILW